MILLNKFFWFLIKYNFLRSCHKFFIITSKNVENLKNNEWYSKGFDWLYKY